MRKSRYIVTTIALSLILLGPLAFAQSQSSFPKGCRDVGYTHEENRLILTPTNDEPELQSLYLIQNISPQPLILTIKNAEYDLFGMNWQTELEPSLWSSFAISKERLTLTCRRGHFSKTESDPTFIDCQTALRICEYNNAKFGDSLFGTYWLNSNKTLKEAVSSSIKKGILLRW